MEYLMLFDSLASMYVVFAGIDLSNYLFSVSGIGTVGFRVNLFVLFTLIC
jgi:hypothetical protein